MSNLWVALWNGRFENAIALILEGADVGSEDALKQTALHLAADRAHPLLVSLLLQHGAHVDVEDRSKRTPLLRAIGRGSFPSQEDHRLQFEYRLQLNDRLQEEYRLQQDDRLQEEDRLHQDRLQCVKILLEAGANVRHCDRDGENALHYATRNPCLTIVKHLLNVDPSLWLAKNNKTERTALHIAADKVQPDIISLLLQHGAQVDEEDEEKLTPLLLAIGRNSSTSEEECRLQCVMILLEAGANIRYCDRDGENALHYATSRCYRSIAEHLLSVDSSLCLVKNSAERTALHIAADVVQPDIISLLMQHGAQVDEEDEEKLTPLLLAIGRNSSPSEEKDRLQCVKILLQARANIRYCNRDGENALHYATSRRYRSIAEHLLSVDSSLCLVKNSAERTALQIAADVVQPDIISHLLQHGAQVDEEDNDSRTPLLLTTIGRNSSNCEEKERLQCVKILLQAGANVRHCDRDGNSALHYATRNSLPIAKYLLTVDPSLCLVKNSRGETALKLYRAAEWGLVDSLSLLLQHGAQVDEEDEEKLTPLLLAIGRNSSPSEEECRLQCVMILLEAGANICYCDRDGENALHYATSRRYRSIAEHLLSVDSSLCLVKNSAERTALHIAADEVQPDIISLLLQHGAQVEEEDELKRTPLLLTTIRRNSYSSNSEEEERLQCLKILLRAGANVRHCDRFGNSALHYARRDNLPSIAQYLLTVDPSLCLVINSHGNIALTLQRAVKWGNPNIILILLQQGAQVDEADNENRAALLLSIVRNPRNSSPSEEECRLKCVKILLEAGANVRHCDGYGNNALHYAIRKSYLSIVQELIMTDPWLLEMENNKGKTPFDLADDNVRAQILQFQLDTRH